MSSPITQEKHCQRTPSQQTFHLEVAWKSKTEGEIESGSNNVSRGTLALGPTMMADVECAWPIHLFGLCHASDAECQTGDPLPTKKCKTKRKRFHTNQQQEEEKLL
ncbi:Hypothetical predicted protein [Podarcis lilfordi]|uniref:Uncharacterized protein n=1 Tax=Podarcis lilfordi TaxID=74358 RepID=A0AA35PUI6_9SAUR|nr:Hypothetical predicted protein [Podarcis lilfordi]